MSSVTLGNPCTHTASCIMDTPPRQGAFVTVVNPHGQTWSPRTHPWCRILCGLAGCAVTGTPHHSITQRGFCALRTLCAPPSIPAPTPTLAIPLFIVPTPAFSTVSCRWGHTGCGFRLLSLSDLHGRLLPSFHGWRAHFFLGLSYIVLSGQEFFFTAPFFNSFLVSPAWQRA